MATSLKKCRDKAAWLGFWVLTLSILTAGSALYVLWMQGKLRQSSKENAALTKKVHELTAIDTTSMPAGKLVITSNDSMYTTNIGWKAIRVNPEEMLKLQIQETDKKMERLMQTVRELERMFKPKPIPKRQIINDTAKIWLWSPDTSGLLIGTPIQGIKIGPALQTDTMMYHHPGDSTLHIRKPLNQ